MDKKVNIQYIRTRQINVSNCREVDLLCLNLKLKFLGWEIPVFTTGKSQHQYFQANPAENNHISSLVRKNLQILILSAVLESFS